MTDKKFKTYVPGAKANPNLKYEVSEAAKIWAAGIIKNCPKKPISQKGEITYLYANAYRTTDGLLQLKMHKINQKRSQRLDPVFVEKIRQYQQEDHVREIK